MGKVLMNQIPSTETTGQFLCKPHVRRESRNIETLLPLLLHIASTVTLTTMSLEHNNAS
jgi:hypothetical protein